MDEVDTRVDELMLKKCFTALFNKVSFYKKLFAEDRSNVLELIRRHEKQSIASAQTVIRN